MEKIVDNYLAWIGTCNNTVEEPVKPTAYVLLWGARLEGQEALANSGKCRKALSGMPLLQSN